MGLFKKLKSNLFKDDEDKLIHDDNGRSLRSLNTQFQAEAEMQKNAQPVIEKEQEVTVKDNIREEKERVFNSDFANSFVNNNIKEYTPQTFAETEEIANQIIRGTKVTVDTSNMKKEDIVRMLDFLSGMMFALKGEIIRNSKFVFTFYVE